MLGAAQEQWLTKGLAQERARWSLVTQQTLFSRVVLPTDPHAVYSHLCDGYGPTRDRVTAALTPPTVPNPTVMSGGLHSSGGHEDRKGGVLGTRLAVRADP